MLILGKELIKYKNQIKKTLLKHFKKGIFIPNFNFKSKFIDFDHNRSMSGLSKLFLEDKMVNQLKNPIHSYIYVNTNLNDKKNFMTKSFGLGSVFDYFTKQKLNWINFGASNNEGWTILHHVEKLCNVSYRKKIKFKRIIIYKKKKEEITFNYFARKSSNIKSNFDLAINDMIQDKVIELINYNNRKIMIGNCMDIVNYVSSKIEKNEKYLIK